jgi:hypothetical protein
VLEWRERAMKALESFVGDRVAKCVNKELRIEE